MNDFEQLAQDLHTIADWHRYMASTLHHAGVWFGHGAADGWEESQLLLAEITAMNFTELAEHGHCRLTYPEKEQLFELLQRRRTEKMPAAYLVNRAWFCGLPFYVDERVLVPRSPIAELIEQDFRPWVTEPPGRILDLCTGSGCIAVACAYAFPEAQVDASDISSDALAVAEKNIAEHQLQDRVQPLWSDIYAGLGGATYDLIVTNPPYVDAEDMADLPAEYSYEPALGLAAGTDGLTLVRRILAGAARHLNPGGLLVCEVGNSMVHVAETWPEIPFMWLEFTRGGDGVMVLTKEQLEQHQAEFTANNNEDTDAR